MIPKLRKKYNADFSQKTYENFIKSLNKYKSYPLEFRICETPLFMSKELTEKIIKAAEEIVEQLRTEEFRKNSETAVPRELYIPNKDNHPAFIQIDFAVCKEDAEFAPKLIELQGFPTTFCFEPVLDEKYRDFFSIPDHLTYYFNEINMKSYTDILKEILIKDEDPENVILLEVEPLKQKTKIDFALTKEILGIGTVDISHVVKKGNKLFYKKNGKEIPVKRIYNRVVYDELVKKNIKINFKFTDDLDTEWADHPSWFFRISKHSLPYLDGSFVPESYYLEELDKYPDDLENYILKPLYSFSGYGVEFDVSKEKLDKIPDKSNYILQRKIEYAPLIETPDGYSMAEIRMIYFWKDHPLLVNNLVRMSKGKMMGLDFNKNKTWVGSSLAYHP